MYIVHELYFKWTMHFCIQWFIFCPRTEVRIWEALANQSWKVLLIFPKSFGWYNSIYKIFKAATVSVFILPFSSTKQTIWQWKLQRKQGKHTNQPLQHQYHRQPTSQLNTRKPAQQGILNRIVTLEEQVEKLERELAVSKKYKFPAGTGDW